MKDRYDFSRGKRGAVLSVVNKTHVKLLLDNDILAVLRRRAAETGTCWETMINDLLRKACAEPDNASAAAIDKLTASKADPLI
jgi:uncharacterized protein (DUF4415 family)